MFCEFILTGNERSAERCWKCIGINRKFRNEKRRIAKSAETDCGLNAIGSRGK